MLEDSDPTARQINPALIKERIRSARLAAGYETEAGLANRIGVSERTIKRWEDPAGTMPKLSEAAKLLRALPITLDWLVGIEMEPADVVRTVAARAGDEVSAMTKMLDLLLKELGAARAALQPALLGVDESELDVTVGRVGKKRAKQRSKPVTVPGKPAS